MNSIVLGGIEFHLCAISKQVDRKGWDHSRIGGFKVNKSPFRDAKPQAFIGVGVMQSARSTRHDYQTSALLLKPNALSYNQVIQSRGGQDYDQFQENRRDGETTE
ncbi:hypothetical protein GCM10025855_38070 [Shewanella glacialipiscicola]|uniref:Uncharacterized protein n=1 Tax=Shewanella glacialipiscicola TaxID=614069 RepID=A0ABQ6JAM6_9GAMM|nr:hypothetical protein GCM10025855_00110 [Shewanella glacialipiscicola]GMA84274.1 hypothetical protein GCM10025855_38070 [Shewanella glacialipiscicola]